MLVGSGKGVYCWVCGGLGNGYVFLIGYRKVDIEVVV